MRKRVIAEEPFCRKGCGRPTTIADHIVPREMGGSDERENYQGLCVDCHNAKIAQEDGGNGRVRMNRVTLVCGPPASGKTTYVAQRMREGELVVDVDALGVALSGQPTYHRPGALLPYVLAARDAVIGRLAMSRSGLRAWVIAGVPNPKERQRLAVKLKAQVIVLEVGVEECLRRIQHDERRSALVREWEVIVRDWWRAYRRQPGETVIEATARAVA